MIVDQLNDPALGHLTRILGAMPALEDFVKEASVDASEIADLPASVFAWPEERRFPLHDAPHAALSYAYSKTASETLPAFVTAAIKQAVEVYGIPETLFVTVKVAHEENPADWLCGDLQLFSCKAAREVPAAQAAFLENYEKLDLPHRKMAAENLVKKAAEFKLDVRPHVLKTAGLTVSHIPTLRRWVAARVEAAPQEFKAGFQKLANDLSRMPEESNDTAALTKLASGLAELDARAGLVKFYDRKLKDPMHTVFNSEKVAADTLDIDGLMVPLQKLKNLPVSFWQDLGGKELAEELAPGGRLDPSKLHAVVQTLPMDLKRVIKSQLRG